MCLCKIQILSEPRNSLPLDWRAAREVFRLDEMVTLNRVHVIAGERIAGGKVNQFGQRNGQGRFFRSALKSASNMTESNP